MGEHVPRIVARHAVQAEAFVSLRRFEAWARKAAPRRVYSVESDSGGWVVVERITARASLLDKAASA